MKQLQAKLYGLTIRARHFRAFNRPDKQDGATAIEYALIAGLIAAVLVGTLTLLGGDIDGLFQSISEAIPESTE